MRTCPDCNGTSFTDYTPIELLEAHGIIVDEEIIICNMCYHDVTESMHIQDQIEEIERYLQYMPKFNDNYLSFEYYKRES